MNITRRGHTNMVIPQGLGKKNTRTRRVRALFLQGNNHVSMAPECCISFITCFLLLWNALKYFLVFCLFTTEIICYLLQCLWRERKIWRNNSNFTVIWRHNSKSPRNVRETTQNDQCNIRWNLRQSNIINQCAGGSCEPCYCPLLSTNQNAWFHTDM